MSRSVPDTPPTGEGLREAVRETRESSEFVTKTDLQSRLKDELNATRGEFIARAEVREIIRDKTSQFVEKSDFAAVKSRVDFLTTGFWAIFALILTVILAAAVKYLFF